MMPPHPLRICHVTYSFYEIDNRVRRYAELLAARGDRVDVISLRRAGQPVRETLNGVDVHRLQRRTVDERSAPTYLLKTLWFFLKCFSQLTARTMGRKYNVVHVHNIPDFLVFTASLPKLLGAKVILDIHDVVPELYLGKFGGSERSLLHRILLMTERLSCRFADHVIVANHLWHDKLIRRSAPPHKCTPMLNYPDLALFRPGEQVTRSQGSRFVFLYPGTLNHHQGLDIAIAAFAEACPRMPGAELHIYGEGPARDALREQVGDLGLCDLVKIMDPVPLHEVPHLMACANAGVVPKRADGFGNEAFSTKILEFMACGIPVIVSRTKVDEFYFTDAVVEFFTPGDPVDLAATMLRTYERPATAAGRTELARELATTFGWQRRSAGYLAIIDTLAPARP